MWLEKFKQFSLMKEEQVREADIFGFKTLLDHCHQYDLKKISSPLVQKIFGGPFYTSVSKNDSVPNMNVVFVQSHEGNTGADNPGDLGGFMLDEKNMKKT
jgi:hypothetical protein